MTKTSPYGILRLLALIAVIVAAAGSLGYMFNAGHNQKSILLIALFTIWVASPFIGLMVANVISKRWSTLIRTTLYFLMLFIAMASLIGYSGAFNPPGTHNAFRFLIIPLISWLLIGIVMAIAVSLSRKQSRKGSDDGIS